MQATGRAVAAFEQSKNEPERMTLAARLLAQAERTPDAIAVADAHGAHSFRRFADRAARLAQGLHERFRLQAGERVLLLMENRSEFLEILFACWQRGYAVVPVNSRLHPKEVLHIAAHSGARVALGSDRFPEVAAALRCLPDCVPLSVDDPAYAALLQSAPSPLLAVGGDALAWLFYTSGTTGRPKGAMLSHRNLEFMCAAYDADIGRAAVGDTQLHAAPLSHGAGLYALPHLFAGGRQQVLAQFDPLQMMEAIAAHDACSFFAAPTMVMRLVNHPQATPERFARLKCIVYGGAPMYVADLEKALALVGPRLYQLYGQGESPMTITGLAQSRHDIAEPQQRRRVLASCGHARSGVEVAVVGDDGQPLPAGAIGEIVTRSPALMAGYWNDEAATRAALKDGWLYTGDLGALDADGLLTLHDRSKDMIISGGSNVYPREIEEVLLRDPRVLECAVVGRPDAEWGELPVAFVVPAPGASISFAELEQQVLDHLARFKRPREWHLLDALPKNHYGKVMKTELRQRLAG